MSRTTRYWPTAIFGASIVHYIWMGALILDPSAINATAPYALLAAMATFAVNGEGPLYAGIICGVVATLSLFGLTRKSPSLRILFALPQLLVLWVSMIGSLQAIYLGQFADGTVRTSGFLATDQSPFVVLCFAYMAALLFMWWGTRRYD